LPQVNVWNVPIFRLNNHYKNDNAISDFSAEWNRREAAAFTQGRPSYAQSKMGLAANLSVDPHLFEAFVHRRDKTTKNWKFYARHQLSRHHRRQTAR